MTRRCIIVGASEFSGFLADTSADFIIAADGGYDNLLRLKITPNIIIGDFDSTETADFPVGCEVVRFPPEKDKSDLELAVDAGIARGFNEFDIYGALGGRLDHSLASIAVLVALSHRGTRSRLVGEREIIAAVTDGRITVSDSGGYVSIFPAAAVARGVSLTGLKYPLTNATLTNRSSLGLSNEFAGGCAEIEVREGTLIVVMTRS
jgi:thiamine pyrophosphokinase